MTLTRPRNKRQWRLLMRQVHLWTTFVVGLPLAILIAAGFAVTYWGGTDMLTSRSFFGPPVTVSTRTDLDSLVAAARAVPQVTRVDFISFTDPMSVAVVAVAR